MLTRIKNAAHRLMSYLGYYRLEAIILDAEKTDKVIQDYISLINEQDSQLLGLVEAVGFLQRKTDDWNTLVSCLVLMHGTDTITLKREFLTGVIKDLYVASLRLDDSGNTVISTNIYEPAAQEPEFDDDRDLNDDVEEN